MEIMRADITDRVTAIFVEVLGVKATEVRENALIVDTCKLGNAASRRETEWIEAHRKLKGPLRSIGRNHQRNGGRARCWETK
ncbi:hypothetical protein FQZ97_679580 [compost metagenome]